MADGRWMKAVFSDMVADVGWDPETQELLVHFKKNGKTAAYKGFDEGTADQLSRAPSVGTMFLSQIKPLRSRGVMSDEEPISENEQRARMFDDMAAQIRLNKDAKFGGAFLLVPPDTQPENFQASLMLNQEEPSIFWASVQTIANMAVQTLDRGQRQQGFR